MKGWVFRRREEESTLGAWERLVARSGHEVCTFPKGILELAAGDQAEDVGPVVKN